MNNYRELTVWQRSVDMATSIYKLTDHFPKSEMFGLTSQLRRCVVSISSNISEGAGRRSPKEFKHFLSISYGSACELETQLLIAGNVGLANEDQLKGLLQEIDEIQKMIYSLQNSI